MSYRSIQLIVPIQYAYGVHKTQTDGTIDMPHYDQDPRTYSSMSLTGDSDLSTVDSVAAAWCFWDGDEQRRVTGTGSFNVEGNGTTIALTSYHAEKNKTASWTISTPNFHRNNTDTTTYQSLLLKLNNTTAYAKWGVDIVGAMLTTAGNRRQRGIYFSKDFAVPLFNRKHRASGSFPQAASRTRTGNDFSDWVAARSAQAILIHEFNWTDLTVAQYTVFENFSNAFGGNIQQPFVMVRILNDGSAPNYEMQFWRLLIQDESLQINKTTGSPARYSVSFTAQEQLINY